ncbi:MAG: pseudouridine synthase [Holosporales bacterium]|jgi:23S rRNA pseudouridine2605 synthase|nr:pseudouridine synthase [Holosporales bacterium]
MDAINLRKYVATHLPASRRKADSLIVNGQVCIDEKVTKIPSVTVSEGQEVYVDGIRLTAREIAPSVWRYYKPRGLVTTHKDPQERPTIFSDLPGNIGRVISVGRLDINTEGLLLITNCSTFARHMELPSNGFIRTYRVKVFGHINTNRLEMLKLGATIENVRYGQILINIEKSSGMNAWLLVSINEGKNREVRKIMAHLELKVARVIRISYGPFKLDGLAPHQLCKISAQKLRKFAKCFE